MPTIRKVLVSRTNDEEEFYISNYDTKIEREEINGPYCRLPTIVVYKRLHAEAPWQCLAEFTQSNIIGIYYWLDGEQNS